MVLQKIICWLGVESYFFVVTKNNPYNTTGKTELHTLNSESYVALGFWESLKVIKAWRD